MDTPHALIEHSLALVAQRLGDPAPQVYAALFAQSPDLAALFVGDPQGSVRGEMFHRALEALLDLAQDRPYAPGMLAAECINHAGLGVPPGRFLDLYRAMVQVFRDALGPAWTPGIDAAWAQALARAAAAAPDAAPHRPPGAPVVPV